MKKKALRQILGIHPIPRSFLMMYLTSIPNLSSPILQSPDKMVELFVKVQKGEIIYNNLPWQYPISVLYTEYAAKT